MAETTEARPEVKPDRKVEQLNPTRFKEAEVERLIYIATAHANTEPEDLLDPKYFAHVAEKLRPWSRIEARADDGTWFAEYLVLEAGRNWAKVKMLSKHLLTSADVAMTQADAFSPYEVKFRGPHAKWSVIRKDDAQVMHEKEETKDGAEKWLVERLKAER